jgi:hypothetical protein
MEKGAFCISIDTELLWGRVKNPTPFLDDAKKIRPVVKKLLTLFEKYQIPATWAIVGEIFNPGDSIWHGQDIIKMIKACPNQEIACHSYSHEIFDENIISQSVAETEIKKCLKVARPLQLRSFVFPKNIVGYLEILKKHGFTSYRGSEQSWFSKIPKLQKLFQILDFTLLFTPPVSSPSKDHSGLVNIPGSMYYVSARGLRKYIPPKFRLIKVKRGLKKAVKKKKIFHLWFHPIDFTQNSPK